MKQIGIFSAAVVLMLLIMGCAQTSQKTAANPELVGAWKSKVQFTSGAFAPIKDLEFMFVFNAGGTMTESSNYDALPPVPPAYGVWKQTGEHTFELHYEYYITRAQTPADSLPAGSGWLPAGHGVLTETVTLASDGKTFTSKIKYDAFDNAGNTAEGGGDATSAGVRMGF